MVRLMVWADLFWPAIGGVEIITQTLLADLHKRGHEIEVMTGLIPPFARDESYQGISVHRLTTIQTARGRNPAFLAEDRSRARSLVTAFQPELMLLMQPLTIAIHYQAAQHLYHGRALYWMQGHNDIMWKPGIMSGQIMRSADYYIACSYELLHSVRKQAPEITDRSTMIWNTLPMPDVERTPLPWNPPTLMYVGRLSPEKGVDTLIRAFALAATQLPDVRLALTGDGPERPMLEELVDSLGIRERVEFRGWAAPLAVPAIMNTTTAIVLPSLTEGLPLVAVQAAQMGRPLIATRVGGNPEICLDGETGLICDPSDAEGMAAQITRLFSDRPLAEAMGVAARHRAETVFAWERLVQSTDDLLRQMATVGVQS